MKRTLIWTLALACTSGACATRTGSVPRPFPVPGAHDPAQAPAAPTAPADPEAAPTSSDAPPPFPGASRSTLRVPERPVGTLDSYALVGTALSYRGTPYRNGGSDPQGFDCSGFTQFVFSRYGISLPRDVRSQYRVGTPIDPSDLAPGDLVFFATTDPDVSHVAIAIGGDGFVHAPSSSGVVRVEHINQSYWSRRYMGARRVN